MGGSAGKRRSEVMDVSKSSLSSMFGLSLCMSEGLGEAGRERAAAYRWLIF